MFCTQSCSNYSLGISGTYFQSELQSEIYWKGQYISIEKLNSEKATSQKTFKVYICKRMTVDRDNVIWFDNFVYCGHYLLRAISFVCLIWIQLKTK